MIREHRLPGRKMRVPERPVAVPDSVLTECAPGNELAIKVIGERLGGVPCVNRWLTFYALNRSFTAGQPDGAPGLVISEAADRRGASHENDSEEKANAKNEKDDKGHEIGMSVHLRGVIIRIFISWKQMTRLPNFWKKMARLSGIKWHVKMARKKTRMNRVVESGLYKRT